MKTKHLKKLGILLGGLAVLFIAAVIIAPKLIDLNNYRDVIVKEIGDAVGGDVNVGSIKWGIKKGIWVEMDGFSVSGSTLLSGDFKVDRIRGEVSPFPLLFKQVVIERLNLESPDATLRLKPASEKGVQAEEKLPKDKPGQVTAPLPVEVIIRKVTLSNGRVKVEDHLTLPGHPMIRSFVDVKIEATDLILGQQMPFRASLRDTATSGLGTMTAQGTFSGLTEALKLKAPALKVRATFSTVS